MSYKFLCRVCPRSLRRDISGGVAVITALGLVVVFGFLSLALDFGQSQAVRAKLDAAADAASLSAARTTISQMMRQSDSGVTNWDVAQAAGIEGGKAAFATNAGTFSGMATPAPKVIVTNNNGVVKASVAWSAQSPLTIGRALGWSSIQMAGLSVSNASPPTHYQFIFLVDVSGSMGIGGTKSAIAALQNDPRIQCAFACHDPEHFRDPVDFRELARAKSIKLKIDFVKDALKLFMDQIAAHNAASAMTSQYSVGIYTYGSEFKTVYAPTTNINAAKAAAETVDIEPVHEQNPLYGETKMDAALTALSGAMRNVGNGLSATQRKTFVVLMSDGIQDLSLRPNLSVHTTNTDFLSGCSSVKSTGANLVSILAPVLPLTGLAYDSARYDELIRPIASDIPAKMRACSSDPVTDYFEAANGPDISAAVTKMLKQALDVPLSISK